ncbi:hypothetical protein C2845_PM01G32140 [Panicum miliaceum]|uniref:Ubiquitin-like protease family profile domain-containing protein n=1 Tax=Panicum miliaceum TaxID=4540 RepID=A0A3L6TGX3_PANMI|nr:hypothetical protein C2845_PM01G32140 [Panicum miliaceum]
MASGLRVSWAGLNGVHGLPKLNQSHVGPIAYMCIGFILVAFTYAWLRRYKVMWTVILRLQLTPSTQPRMATILEFWYWVRVIPYPMYGVNYEPIKPPLMVRWKDINARRRWLAYYKDQIDGGTRQILESLANDARTDIGLQLDKRLLQIEHKFDKKMIAQHEELAKLKKDKIMEVRVSGIEDDIAEMQTVIKHQGSPSTQQLVDPSPHIARREPIIDHNYKLTEDDNDAAAFVELSYDNTTVVEIEGHLIAAKQLRAIVSEGFMVGLDAYVDISNVKNASVSFISTLQARVLLTENLRNDKYMQFRKLINDKCVGRHLVFVPMNVNNNHWVLLVLNVKKIEVQILNSIAEMRDKEKEKALPLLVLLSCHLALIRRIEPALCAAATAFPRSWPLPFYAKLPRSCLHPCSQLPPPFPKNPRPTHLHHSRCLAKDHPAENPMLGLPFDGALPRSSSPGLAMRRTFASSSSLGETPTSPTPAPAPVQAQVQLEEGELPPDGESVATSTGDDAVSPQRPGYTDVYMPPIRLSLFSQLAFAVVDTPTTAPAQVVRDVMVGQGGNPRVTLASSTFGAMLSNNAHENTVERQPFLGREHTVTLVRHDDNTPNRHYFEHKAFVTVAIKDYPLEHRNRERIIFSVSPYANPNFADPGVDFSAIILTINTEGVADIPFEEYFKNHCGVGALACLEIVNVELLGDSGSDSDSSGPPSPGPWIPSGAGDGAGLSTPAQSSGSVLGARLGAPDANPGPGVGGARRMAPPLHMHSWKVLLLRVEVLGRCRWTTSSRLPSGATRDNASSRRYVGAQSSPSQARWLSARTAVPFTNFGRLTMAATAHTSKSPASPSALTFVETRVSSIGTGGHTTFSVDVICSGPMAPLGNLSLLDAANLCDAGGLPCSFPAVEPLPPKERKRHGPPSPAVPVTVVTTTGSPTAPAPLGQGSPPTPSFNSLDLEVQACNKAGSFEGGLNRDNTSGWTRASLGAMVPPAPAAVAVSREPQPLSGPTVVDLTTLNAVVPAEPGSPDLRCYETLEPVAVAVVRLMKRKHGVD